MERFLTCLRPPPPPRRTNRVCTLATPLPLVLAWACPNTVTPWFRTFGPSLEPSFFRFQSNRESGLQLCADCKKGQSVKMFVSL